MRRLVTFVPESRAVRPIPHANVHRAAPRQSQPCGRSAESRLDSTNDRPNVGKCERAMILRFLRAAILVPASSSSGLVFGRVASRRPSTKRQAKVRAVPASHWPVAPDP